MFCGEGSLVKRFERSVSVLPLWCRSWLCESCRPGRKSGLIKKMQAGKPSHFITLTSRPHAGGTPAERAALLAEAWRKIVRKAGRRWKNGKIQYGCAFEATKAGEPHLHILARCAWISQSWLSGQMRELTGAPIVDIRGVRSARQVASYVSKYVGKAPHRFGTSKRYWFTRGWDLTPHDAAAEDRRRRASWLVTREGQSDYIRSFDPAAWWFEWDGWACVMTPRGPPEWRVA